ncbi:hypothetical protein ACQ4PT_048417 [Festuca glaucescens]
MSSSAGDGCAPPSSASKGKARMDDEAEAEGVPCGICLTDSRRAIRGELDCCAHHFCFVCIMAWARVESRCPYCKARFRTIRRPPVPGRLPSERIVTVAQRIQVWHPLGNESSVVGTDPSANSTCSVCICTNDEDLLLLCELCDVAAHTYCAGLGTTVPEDDWFCKDCATSKEEHSRCQVDDGRCLAMRVNLKSPLRSRALSQLLTLPVLVSWMRATLGVQSLQQMCGALGLSQFLLFMSSGPVPSIYDIVDEDYEGNSIRRANLRRARPDRKKDDFPSEDTSSDESLCLGSPQERASGRTLLHAHARFGIERARTLRNSRNLTRRITELRENWSALRAGSVGFTEHVHNNRRENSGATSSVNDHQQSRMTFTKETATISGHANKIAPKETRHVSKAWKMLEMAKSAGGRKKCNTPSSQDCTPRFSMGNRSTSFSPIDTILGQNNQSLSTLVAQRNTVKYDRGAKKDSTLPKKDPEGHRNMLGNCHVLVLERNGPFQDRMVNKESPNGKVASSSHSQRVEQTPESSCASKAASSSHRQHGDPTLGSSYGSRGSGKPRMDMLRPSSNSLSSGRSTVTSPLQFVSSAGSQSGTMVNPEEPPAVRVTASSETGTAAAATLEVRKTSGSDRHGSKRKLFETSDDQGSKKLRKRSKIAKGEISSLALRELKLLKIDKTYGSERFKEAARATTHTVLASYGLEHSAELAVAVPKPVCKHKPPRPSVIPNTCKECLCGFVKLAIRSVLSGQRMDQAAPSC